MHTILRNSNENLQTVILTRCIHRKDQPAPIDLADSWTCYAGSKELSVREFFNAMKEEDAVIRNERAGIINMDDLLERVLASGDYAELKSCTFETPHKAFTDVITVAEVTEIPESCLIEEMAERLKSLPAELISIVRFDSQQDYVVEAVSRRDGKSYYDAGTGEKCLG